MAVKQTRMAGLIGAEPIEAVPVHPGMRTRSQSGGDALSGHHASGIDAATGRGIVPGEIPEGVARGPALDVPPVAKEHSAPLRPVPGHRNRSGEVGPAPVGFHATDPARQQVPNDLGEAILADAFRPGRSLALDRAAHGRDRTGFKIKSGGNE